jgi:hypothetical protein
MINYLIILWVGALKVFVVAISEVGDVNKTTKYILDEMYKDA